MLRVLHADLDGPANARVLAGLAISHRPGVVACMRWPRSRHGAAVVQTDDIATRDDLPQTPVHGVAHLDKVFVEKDQKSSVQACRVSTADKLHDHAARDVPVLVDVHGAFAVRNQELALAQSEHPQRSQIFDPVRNARQVRLRFRCFGAQVRHRPRLLLVEGQNFDSTLRRNGERCVEQVDVVTFCGNIELVIFTEELGLATTHRQETRPARC